MIGTGAAWQELLKKIREEIKGHSKALNSGQFKDFTEARELVAKIAALQGVIETARALLGDNDKIVNRTAAEEDYLP